MATRFRLPRSGTAPDVSPAFSATWAATSVAATRELLQVSSQGTALGTYGRQPSAGSNPQNLLLKQFVSAPLAGQTISGTITGQIQGFEQSTSNNFGPQLRAYIWRPSDLTVLLLYEVDTYNAGGSTPPEFPTTTATNRVFPQSGSAGNLTSQVAKIGDRLVVEVGWRASSTATQGITSRFGENGAGGDCPQDQTSTGTTLNPWIEFSGTIAFTAIKTVESLAIASVKTIEGASAVKTILGLA